jgi:cyanophycin synthetase
MVADVSSASAAPLTILETSLYRGPNLYSVRPMARIQLDLGELEAWPTDRLPGFTDRLVTLLPTLERHGCCYGQPGGFLRRLRDGTWLGHVIEHVALELQSLAGSPTTRGKTRSVSGRVGVYNVLYSYRVERAALVAGAYAIRLVAALLPEGLRDVGGTHSLPQVVAPADDVGAIVAELSRLIDAARFGPTTQALVDEAARRGIPVTRLNEQSLVQLGLGSRQRRLRASVTGQTALIAAELAGNKDEARRLLADAGLPVPRGVTVATASDAVREAHRLRFPVVLKPLDGNHGRGVTTAIGDDQAVEAAFRSARQFSRRVIVERL